MTRRPSTPLLAIALAVLSTSIFAGAPSSPAMGQAVRTVPDRYQFMVGRDVPEAWLEPDEETPTDMAAAPDGTVFVLYCEPLSRCASHRVLRLAQTGRLINAWRSAGRPTALAAAPDGAVLLADEEGRRMVRYTAWGAYQGSWPLNNEPLESPCSTTEPVAAIAAGREGKVYVAAGTRIQVRDADGRCLAGWDLAWEQPGAPRDIVVDPEGNVYASAYDRSLVAVYDPSGRRVRSFGRTGAGEGEFGSCPQYSRGSAPCGPVGLAIAPDGTLLAADHGNYRIQRFTLEGAFVEAWSALEKSSGARPQLVAAATDGTVFVSTDRFVAAYTSSGSRLDLRRTGAPPSRALLWPRAVATGPRGEVYVADTGYHRVQHYDADGAHVGSWGSQGWGRGDMRFPQGVAVAPDGTVVVADTGNRRLQRFDGSGRLLEVLAPADQGQALLAEPRGVDVAPSGDIYVADAGRDEVLHLAADGTLKAVLAIGAETGSGPLSAPSGVAVDTDGAVWVADTRNHRVVKFSPSGDVAGTWGTPGSGPGQLDGPSGIALIKDGQVIVADEGNARLQRFSANLAEALPSAVLGAPGCGRGRFTHASDVAVAPDGTLIAADASGDADHVGDTTVVYERIAGSDRLVRFRADGTPLASFGYGLPGDARFHEVGGLAPAADGTVTVADSGSRRVQRLGPRGEILQAFGEPGCEAGQMHAPAAVAAGAAGDLYVADPRLQRVSRFATDGTLLTAWGGADPERVGFSGIRHAVVASNGAIYAALGGRVVHMDRDGRLLDVIAPPDWPRGDYELSPRSIAVDADDTLITVSAAPPWVRRFGPSGELLSAWGDPSDTSPGRCRQPVMQVPAPDGTAYGWAPDYTIERCDREGNLLAAFGGAGGDPGQLGWALDMAVSPSGDVLVLDRSYVHVFSSQGAFLRRWSHPDTIPGLTRGFPLDVAPDGSVLFLCERHGAPSLVYRTDTHGTVLGSWPVASGATSITATPEGWMVTDRSHLHAYAADGRLLRSWHATQSGPEFLETPGGIAVAAGGTPDLVYVSDVDNDRIQVYAPDGSRRATLGRAGSAPGEFSRLRGIAVDRAGDLWVADAGNHRVQHLSPGGDVVAMWGEEGDGPGQFRSPAGVAVSADGTVFVADTGNRRVQAFATDGTFLGAWNTTGDAGGALGEPTAIAVAADGNVWVGAEGRVLVFGAASPAYWHVRAYRDQSLIDGPVHISAVSGVAFDWGDGAPAEGLPADGFSVRVERPAGARTGGVPFELRVRGGVTMSAERHGPVVILTGQPGTASGELGIESDRQIVRLDYADLGGPAALYLRLGLERRVQAWLPLAMSGD